MFCKPPAFAGSSAALVATAEKTKMTVTPAPNTHREIICTTPRFLNYLILDVRGLPPGRAGVCLPPRRPIQEPRTFSQIGCRGPHRRSIDQSSYRVLAPAADGEPVRNASNRAPPTVRYPLTVVRYPLARAGTRSWICPRVPMLRSGNGLRSAACSRSNHKGIPDPFLRPSVGLVSRGTSAWPTSPPRFDR